MQPTPATSAPRQCRALALLLELALTLLVAIALRHLAQPLALADLALGLGQRYADQAPAAQRALWLLLHAPQWLPAGAAGGWLAMVLARRARRGSSSTLLALYALAGVWLVPSGVSPVYCGAAALALALLAGLRNLLGSANRAVPVEGGPDSLAAALIWPLWLACAGAGWLWQADFAARGPLRSAFLGNHQLDALWLASLALALSCRHAHAAGRALVTAAIALRGWASQPRRLALLLLLVAITAGALAWVGRRKADGGLGMPHASGEWSRWALLVTAAWFGYRRLDWAWTQAGAASLDLWRARAGAALPTLLAGAVAGLGGAVVWAGSSDWGPAMVMSLTLVMMVGAVLCLPSELHWRARAVGGLWVVVVAVAWSHLATDMLPAHHHRAAQREAMRADPHHAASDQYATALWLLAASADGAPGASGPGLARVPYCGARAHLGLQACTAKGQGVGVAFGSDLPLVALRATWGWAGAALALAAFVGLLLAALAAALRRAEAGQASAVLLAWMVAVFAVTALVQTAMVTAANLGRLPLSGLGLPLLANGNHAALALSLWLGWACRAAAR